MNARLDNIIASLRNGGSTDLVTGLSTGERCYVALAARRSDLLPVSYAHPVEAWNRLDADWQCAVCRHNGWPESWVTTTDLEIAVDLYRLNHALDAVKVSSSTLPGFAGLEERIEYLVAERDSLQAQLHKERTDGR